MRDRNAKGTRAYEVARTLLDVAQDPEHPHWASAVKIVIERLDPAKLAELAANPAAQVVPVVIQVTLAGGQTRPLEELDGEEWEAAARAYLASLPNA
jgi:hypothetical protein